jgi:hypothetical protein
LMRNSRAMSSTFTAMTLAHRRSLVTSAGPHLRGARRGDGGGARRPAHHISRPFARAPVARRRDPHGNRRDRRPGGVDPRGVGGRRGRGGVGRPATDDEDRADYLASVRRLRSLDPTRVHFAHDPLVWERGSPWRHGRHGIAESCRGGSWTRVPAVRPCGGWALRQ